MIPRTYRTPGGSVPSLYLDMLRQPHCLIAGASGSGKSVVLNGLISSLIRGHSPATAQLVLVDPKRVELAAWARLPHCIGHVTEPDDIARTLSRVLEIIDRRYRDAQAAGQRIFSGAEIYVIIDELADLMTTDRKRIQPLLQRIAQIGRAARVHLIAATQCPLASVIPTAIKCNFSAVLGLHARSAQDSRNIIGFSGLERLPMYGRGAYLSPGRDAIPATIRLVPDDEITELVQYWTSPSCIVA